MLFQKTHFGHISIPYKILSMLVNIALLLSKFYIIYFNDDFFFHGGVMSFNCLYS